VARGALARRQPSSASAPSCTVSEYAMSVSTACSLSLDKGRSCFMVWEFRLVKLKIEFLPPLGIRGGILGE
jgi:hypothetical protein